MSRLDEIRSGLDYWALVLGTVKAANERQDDETGGPPFHLKSAEKEIEQIIHTHQVVLEAEEKKAVEA
jgi:hypothetical protein